MPKKILAKIPATARALSLSLLPVAVTIAVTIAVVSPRPTFAFTRIFLTSTTTTTWTVPSDWNSASNTIEVIGGGANGNSWGGGGGGYSESSNVSLTPGATVTIRVGVGGSAGFSFNSGTSTYLCNSTSNCASIAGSAVVVGANGGIATFSGPTGATTTGAVGTTHKYAGGNGGNPACCGNAGGGGGGAAGPLGAGGNGSDSVTNSTPGGGGGNGGGSSSVASTTGGNNQAGTGGAVSGNATNGGGGGAASSIGGNGGNGTEWDATHGSGGGGGGGDNTHGGNGGLYGGGAGGDGNSIGGAGGQGIIVVTYTPPPPPDITTGLVGWWKLDEGSGSTAVDSSVSGNNGTEVNGPSYVAGKIKPFALSFTFTNQYVQMSPIPQLSSGDLTVGGWFYFNSIPTSQWLLNEWDTSAHGVALFMIGAQIYWEVGSYTGAVQSVSTVTTGSWYHIVGVLQGSTLSIYINGVLNNQVTGYIPGYSGINNFSISNNGAKGGINTISSTIVDDARMYDRALSSTDVAALYAYTAPVQKIQNFTIKAKSFIVRLGHSFILR